mmetsp:Transcript_39922/g.123363  ORF Transcript_39922/g.123363 Transcript_39922/m.123363 type:complete len:81 (+) Transcript_39922:30-272(+)|eukprot:CAMPEP_0174850536 /NCGR_PEP_ID=MMETSP1114-20130205/19819_1 /TAXON_ID=312471 /ORGANISM="Neobodo designis, Strain CCAP 1951/1" /LENGTH=80 /DNA_ID=CAMNT_0016085001 /DNA_START=30 /DNA_END=272 /DNA_ORIENTATION=+
MFRRSISRLGHQLIKEPMPNVEHDTTARGRATLANVKSTLEREMTVMGCGAVVALYSFWSAYSTSVPTVKASGAIVTETK